MKSAGEWVWPFHASELSGLPMEVDASGAQVSADTKCFQRIINKVEAAP
jgi:hypothetical protein